MNTWSAIGFEKEKKYFERILKNESLTHAYLFTGPEMIGKKKFALDLYTMANHRDDILPTDADFKYIVPKKEEDETKIYIDNIRELKVFLSFRPLPGPYKCVIVDDAHCLTDEAENAFLKVLEEPLPRSLIILVTSQPRLLLPTIISRCQEIRFSPPALKDIDEFLSDKKLSKGDREFIITMAGRRLGWLVEVLETHKLERVKEIIEEFKQVVRQGTFERLHYAKKIYDNGVYPEYVDLWLRWIRAYGKNPQKTRAALSKLLNVYQLIAQPQYNHRLALENFLISL
ncbi:MAG TPA: hypothetical protein VEK36_00475 [Candidatus Paceibacterota bacterium]|nr:hypothetical protein [Candidatus Paceibacterota bacterium]